MDWRQRLYWEVQKWKRRLATPRAEWGNAWKSASHRHAVCPSCRALVGIGERRCTYCGAALAGGPGRLSRLLEPVLPRRMQATALLLGANFLLYVVQVALSTDPGQPATFLAALFSGGTTGGIIRLGSCFGPLVLQGEVWRFLTANFLHGGLLHLGFNTYAALVVLPLAEEEFGRYRMTVLYLLAGGAGFVASFAWRLGMGNSVGASAAIFGMMGAMIVHGLRRGGHFGKGLVRTFGNWAIYAVVMSLLMPRVDNAAHIGGLAAGALLALVPAPRQDGTGVMAIAWKVAAQAMALLVLISFALVLLRPVSLPPEWFG